MSWLKGLWDRLPDAEPGEPLPAMTRVEFVVMCGAFALVMACLVVFCIGICLL
jgi:hypothetical protein